MLNPESYLESYVNKGYHFLCLQTKTRHGLKPISKPMADAVKWPIGALFRVQELINTNFRPLQKKHEHQEARQIESS